MPAMAADRSFQAMLTFATVAIRHAAAVTATPDIRPSRTDCGRPRGYHLAAGDDPWQTSFHADKQA